MGSKLKDSLTTVWVVREKNSKIGNAYIDNFLRYDTEEF